jgi:hypothetical protein
MHYAAAQRGRPPWPDGERPRDRTAATQPLREGFRARLRADVLEENPGLADEGEIERYIEIKLRCHYARMQASSLRTRRANASRKRQQ